MRILCFAVVVALCSAELAAQRPREGGRGQERGEPAELTSFRYQTLPMTAPSMRGEQVSIGLYLPVDYDKEANAKKTYPYAVWLHGRNEDHDSFHRRGGARALDEMRGKDEIPEMIFVALGASRSPVYIDGVRDGDQEKLVVEDLPNWLEANYRVAKAREGRALMGVSIGGFGALKIALRHLDKFVAVAAHSSAVVPADPDALPEEVRRQVMRMLQSGGLDEVFGDPIDAKKWAAEMPMALVRDLPVEKLKTLKIYFDAISEDRYRFGPPNQALHELLEEREVPHSFELIPGQGHSWGSGVLQQQLRKSLKFVGDAFRGAEKPAANEPAAAKPAKEAKPVKGEAEPAVPAKPDGEGRK